MDPRLDSPFTLRLACTSVLTEAAPAVGGWFGPASTEIFEGLLSVARATAFGAGSAPRSGVERARGTERGVTNMVFMPHSDRVNVPTERLRAHVCAWNN